MPSPTSTPVTAETEALDTKFNAVVADIASIFDPNDVNNPVIPIASDAQLAGILAW